QFEPLSYAHLKSLITQPHISWIIDKIYDLPGEHVGHALSEDVSCITTEELAIKIIAEFRTLQINGQAAYAVLHACSKWYYAAQKILSTLTLEEYLSPEEAASLKQHIDSIDQPELRDVKLANPFPNMGSIEYFTSTIPGSETS